VIASLSRHVSQQKDPGCVGEPRQGGCGKNINTITQKGPEFCVSRKRHNFNAISDPSDSKPVVDSRDALMSSSLLPDSHNGHCCRLPPPTSRSAPNQALFLGVRFTAYDIVTIRRGRNHNSQLPCHYQSYTNAPGLNAEAALRRDWKSALHTPSPPGCCTLRLGPACSPGPPYPSPPSFPAVTRNLSRCHAAMRPCIIWRCKQPIALKILLRVKKLSNRTPYHTAPRVSGDDSS